LRQNRAQNQHHVRHCDQRAPECSSYAGAIYA
jgi:hypothetical protein